jgi:hypothetical protein
MGMRGDIVGAMQTAQPGYPPETTEWRLSTSRYDAPAHKIMLPEEWNGSMRSVIPTPAESDAILRMLHPERFAGLPPGAVLRIPAIHEPS